LDALSHEALKSARNPSVLAHVHLYKTSAAACAQRAQGESLVELRVGELGSVGKRK